MRYLSNYSSGKMGYAIARAAARRGARVLLVSGPTALTPPAGVEFLPVTSARQMRERIAGLAAEATVIVKAAAVADYRPAGRSEQKIKKGKAGSADPGTGEESRHPRRTGEGEGGAAAGAASPPKPPTCWPTPARSCGRRIST